MQRENAATIATFAAWKRLDRTVTKGEKGLMILQPIKRTFEKENTKGEKETRSYVAFRPLYLFDFSQTSGKELPERADLPRVGTDACALRYSVNALKRAAMHLECTSDDGSPVSPVSEIEIRESTASDNPGWHGWYNRLARSIVVITTNRTPLEQFATLVHEIAHAILHGDLDQAARHSRPEREVEAESVAYVVCATLGLDVGAYAFPYVSIWAHNGEGSAVDTVAKTGDRIVRASNLILDALMGESVESVDLAA